MQATIRMPPKSVFQFLCDPTWIEEVSKVTVVEDDGPFGEGFGWTEKRLLQRRRWEVTAYDRRALTFSATDGTITLHVAAKKGGTMSCNVQMRAEGPAKAVAKFEGEDRIGLLRTFLEGEPE